MTQSHTLHVLLNDLPVGRLTLDHQGRCEFRFLESYRQIYPRPVLGQAFLDDLDQVHTTRARVPPWFSNLLPEGPLRELIARRAGVSEVHEFHLLHHLGEDLPGAVRLVAESNLPPPDDEVGAEGEESEFGEWRFSLAGVQLKFSARRQDRGLTIPVSGLGGDWVVKLPDARLPDVPRVEWSTIRWAAAAGIRVPEIALVELADIQGLPESLASVPERHAFAIRRFDRPEPGRRTHMEDMAQVLGLYPKRKYDGTNYETLARIVLAVCGDDGLDELLRRLLFNIVVGNGDAHLKNWTLVYKDGVRAELSPAYDLVSTIQYMAQERLALNLGKSKRWESVTRETFLRLARKIGVEEELIDQRVASHAEQIARVWRKSEDQFGFTDKQALRLQGHWSRTPIVAERHFKD